MKYLILALCLFSFKSYAATSIKKTFDGGEARCLEMSEVGSRAYNLEVLKEVVFGDSKILTLKVNFYKCAEVPSGYGLRPSSPDEVLSSFIIRPDGSIGMTKNTLVQSTFYATDVDGKVLGISDLLIGEKKSTITFTINKKIKRVFIDANLTSDITSPIGNLEGVVQKYGGFVLSL